VKVGPVDWPWGVDAAARKRTWRSSPLACSFPPRPIPPPPLSAARAPLLSEPVACESEPVFYAGDPVSGCAVSAVPVGTGQSSSTRAARSVAECSPHESAPRAGLFSWASERLCASSNLDLASMALDLPRLCRATRCGLADFVHRSLHPPAALALPSSAQCEIWPCPPPLMVEPWHPGWPTSGRRRERWKLRASARELVRYAVCSLNWLTLGFARVPPACCVAGAPMSVVQQQHVGRLEELCSHVVRLGRGSGSELGRALDKF
jgi:hypothetical protein